MKIIVPMAGRGSRLRPHTLTVPKPLLPVAGKPIVQRLVEDIAAVSTEAIEEIAFIIGDFGSEVEEELIQVAENLGAKGVIYHQEEALGTAHAVLCAKESLEGKVVVAFADTLFKADFKLDTEADGILWVKQIEDPSAFGVVKLNEQGTIVDYIEKPQTFISDLAMIGIYYFKDGAGLREELQYLIDNDVIKSGEYQLPDALRNLTNKGISFVPGEVKEWMDCGNKKVTVETNSRVFELGSQEHFVDETVQLNNTTIIPPCYIAKGAVLNQSVIGPCVSVGVNTQISHSVIEHTIIQNETTIKGQVINASMIGNKVQLNSKSKDYSIGDYTVIEG